METNDAFTLAPDGKSVSFVLDGVTYTLPVVHIEEVTEVAGS